MAPKSLIHVACTGSVSRAAADMDLTQSRVSQLLEQLETGVDVALFTRIGKGLALTSAGRTFANAAAERAPFPAERLHELELVLLPGRYYMRQLSDRFFSRHHVRPRVSFEIDSLPAIVQTVHGSRLATLLPPFVIARNEAAGLISRRLADARSPWKSD